MFYLLSNEQKLNMELSKLFSTWKSLVANEPLFVEDGFYPFYTQQSVKILFIGREALGIANSNYIEILLKAYRENTIDGKHINKYKFHRLLFYIAYGIINHKINWAEIPCTSELTNTFATKNSLSFAFMNLSKFSNESNSWNANWHLIESFLDKSKKIKQNLFNREIELLSPDLIITMNLGKYLNILGNISNRENENRISYMELEVGSKQIPLIDTFHFAAPCKSDYQYYYKPIIDKLVQKKLFRF